MSLIFLAACDSSKPQEIPSSGAKTSYGKAYESAKEFKEAQEANDDATKKQADALREE